jgi:ubiquinone/menaquinone biosynthesis C-methylase UbiE
VKQKVHSFDLVALNEHVTVANMSNVPLEDESVDIAVFCLSLMGTNFADYLVEAHRVLKKGGLLKIAELESRFVGMKKFLLLLEKLGFELKQKTQPNGYFYVMNFEKTGDCKKPNNIKEDEILKPCLYKKR